MVQLGLPTEEKERRSGWERPWMSPGAREDWVFRDRGVTLSAVGTKSRRISGSNTPLSAALHITVRVAKESTCTQDSERNRYMDVTSRGVAACQQQLLGYPTPPCFVGFKLVAKSCRLSPKRKRPKENGCFSSHRFASITRKRGPNSIAKQCNNY